MTLKSRIERSHSSLIFIREQFWYKLLIYEIVKQTIKIYSLLYYAIGVIMWVGGM